MARCDCSLIAWAAALGHFALVAYYGEFWSMDDTPWDFALSFTG